MLLAAMTARGLSTLLVNPSVSSSPNHSNFQLSARTLGSSLVPIEHSKRNKLPAICLLVFESSTIKPSIFISSQMAAAIFALGALTYYIIEKRKSHKAFKQSNYNSKHMEKENMKFYLQQSPSSKYSQTTPQETFDSDARTSLHVPPV
jgi:hypothetical protein